MKKIILFLVLLCVQVNVFAIPETNSPSVYFYHLDKEDVLYEKESDKEIAIASLTKIMTASVALDLIDDLDETVVLTANDFQGLVEANASVAGFEIGEEVTYRDLLYGLLLPSGADAALALANNLAGSEEAFVVKMNEKAATLNLKHTNFVNTTGLDTTGHYSSASDVAMILKDALNNPDFKEIFTTKKYVTSNVRHTFQSTLETTASVYKLDVSDILGSKTGYTDAAGLCLASIAQYNGENYLLITANADYSNHKPNHIIDSITLYQYFFENYEYRTLLSKGQDLKTVMDANEVEHNFTSTKDIILYLSKESVIDYKYDGVEVIGYDMEAGDKIGEYQVLVDGEVIDTQEFFLDAKIIEPETFSWMPVGIVAGILLVVIIIIIIISKKKKAKVRM